MYTHGSLFSGIEGFGLAAHWMGWENAFHCEWNPFGRHIAHHYWPNAKSYNDVTKTDFTIWRGRIDVLTGGFPCQPFSTAGKRKGTDDSRYLWPEMLRAIREIHPRWVVGENVYGLVNWDGGLVFDTVCADLENEGFEVWPVVLPAAGVNAPHRRDRIWFIARNTKLHGCATAESGGSDNGSPVTSGENQVGKPTGTDSVQSAWVQRPPSHPHNQGTGDGLGEIQDQDGEIPQRDYNAEPGDTDTRPTENPNNDGRIYKRDEGKNELGQGDRHTGAGDNERISAYDGETGTLPYAERWGVDTVQKQVCSGLANGYRSDGNGEIWDDTGKPTDWQIWPTVAPLCSGDDGFSELLDADTVSEVAGKKVRNTFSWWRQESIKAGGNAIVPEVAFRLFRTMAAFDKLKG